MSVLSLVVQTSRRLCQSRNCLIPTGLVPVTVLSAADGLVRAAAMSAGCQTMRRRSAARSAREQGLAGITQVAARGGCNPVCHASQNGARLELPVKLLSVGLLSLETRPRVFCCGTSDQTVTNVSR